MTTFRGYPGQTVQGGSADSFAYYRSSRIRGRFVYRPPVPYLNVAGLRNNIEDLHSLKEAANSELNFKLASSIQNNRFGFSSTLSEEYDCAKGKYQSLVDSRSFDADRLTISYQSMNYRVNFDQVSWADPYAFLGRAASDTSGLPNVSDDDLDVMKTELVSRLRASVVIRPFPHQTEDEQARDHRISVLRANFSHMDVIPGMSLTQRQIDFRKRMKNIFDHLHNKEIAGEPGLLLNFAQLIEGDSVAHCPDGLDTQLNIAELSFLGSSSAPRNIGDLISRVIKFYTSQFIKHHREIYLSRSSPPEEATYVVLSLMRRMHLSLGVLSDLSPLTHPSFVPSDTRTSSEAVINRFFIGEILRNSRGDVVIFEALTPQKLIRLLDEAARKALSKTVVADRLIRIDDMSGPQVSFQFIAEQFEDRGLNNSAFRVRYPEFANELTIDYEDYALNPTVSSIFFHATPGGQTLPTDEFWKRMLVHYQYIIPN